tara:strand:+ start:75 stop:605 length:531 start_codon:yes stop_codon:yes gene_type:complete
MGQEFFINSENLQSKINELLPSQGGAGSGFDLSASTQIIPIIDLTESAEGSNVREDIQKAISFGKSTVFSITSAGTSTIISNTGYFRIFGTVNCGWVTSGSNAIEFILNDGTSDKIINAFRQPQSTTDKLVQSVPTDFTIFLDAGDTFKVTTVGATINFIGSFRQIADINGSLINP